MRPLPEIIRDLAVLAERDGLTSIAFAEIVEAITGRDCALPGVARMALEAASILRRLDDGTLDVATLIDGPWTNLDAAREAYVAQYEGQLTAACRALAGVE